MKQVLFVVLLLHVFKAEAQTSASSVADSLYAVGNYTKAINYKLQEAIMLLGISRKLLPNINLLLMEILILSWPILS